MRVEWNVGRVGTRREIAKVFGGSPVGGGICPANETSSVLLFSDPEVGEKFGYCDGWLREEDKDGPIFEYTGHGKGNQTFEGSEGTGNRAVRYHTEAGRTLRVFKAVGKLPGRDAKRHEYLGCFELDRTRPYDTRQAPNDKHVMRRVIVFRLRPVGADIKPRKEDTIPAASQTSVVRADVTRSLIVPPETNKKVRGSRSATPITSIERREARLSDSFQEYMNARGRHLTRFQIKIEGLTSTLLTDLYDDQGHVLYELKGVSSREAVRMAIGQLFDYRRFIEPSDPVLAVLLPEEPYEDLRHLLGSLGIALVYKDGERFVGVPGFDD